MPAPFISRQDLTEYLDRDVTTDDGALICVDAGCDIVRDVTGQLFNRGTVTEYYDGTGTDALLLAQFPVNSVGTVSVADSDAPPTWNVAGSTDFSVDDKGVLLATNTAGTSLFGRTWPHGRQNVRVTYDYGYTLVPSSVRQIALTVASRLFIQGPKLFESLGDLNVRYAAESTALMPTERMILRRYKRAR